jgi:hypothetical protein
VAICRGPPRPAGECARSGVGAATLALLFGLFGLVYGVSQIVMGAQPRETGHPVMEKHAA